MSQVVFSSNQATLTAKLAGEVDQHSAKHLRADIDAMIKRSAPKKLVLDLAGVSFMDSSGVGLILGRYKHMQSINGTLSLANMPSQCSKIISMSGITKVLDIQENNDANL